MSDDLPSLKAAEYIRLIMAEYGPAQGRDVLCEIACGYLVWLGLEQGRDKIDDLMRERINKSLVLRNSENPRENIKLVWTKPSAVGGVQ